MFYTIYKITNRINGKFYIGKHQTPTLNDGYMGSGKLLKRAIAKYGIESFTKEIIHVFDNEIEMNVKEQELVVIGEQSYNICPGGNGGFGYVNVNGLNNKDHDEKVRDKQSKALKGRRIPEEIVRRVAASRHRNYMLGMHKKEIYQGFLGKHHTEETKAKQRMAMSGRVPWNKGIPRTEEEKERIRQGMLKAQ